MAPRPTRRRDVQVLRGVAVLLVVAFHAELPLSGGFVGVDVFFVISGYVIVRGLLREMRSTGRISFGDFYARRVRRLLPMLAVTLIATAAVSAVWLGGEASTRTSQTAAAAAVFNANTYLGRQPAGYFDQDPTDNALLHTWSLSVEEQFYLVIPALLVAAWVWGSRRGRERGAVVALVTVLALMSVALAWITGAGRGERLTDLLGFTVGGTFEFYTAPARAWEFLAGVMLAVGERRIAVLPRRARLAGGLAGAGLITYAALSFNGFGGFAPPKALIPVAGASLVLLPGMGVGRNSARWQRLGAPFVWIGDRSYAWYLTHWPLIVFAAILTDRPVYLSLAALVALGLAEVAHRWIEAPFQRNERIRGRRAVGVMAVCVIVPAVVGLLAAGLSRAVPVPGIDQARRQHFQYTGGCTSMDKEGFTSVCRVKVAGAHRSVFLIGDSHAGQWSEPVREAARQAGSNLTIVGSGACPVLPGLVREFEGSVREDCARTIDVAFRLIRTERPDVVIIGFASLEYVTGDGVKLSLDDGPRVSSVPDRAELWRRALRRTVTNLTNQGVPVVVVHDNPGTDLPPTKCGWILHAVNNCLRSVDRETVERDRSPVLRAEQDAVHDVEGVLTLDPTPSLCTDRCANQRDGTWLYRDTNHMSLSAANVLAPRFAEVVRRALASNG